MRQMPRNRLALAVGVSRKINLFAFLGLFFQFLDHIAFSNDVDIFRLKIMLDINPDFTFRQIADMAFGCHYLIIFAQILFDTFDFGR